MPAVERDTGLGTTYERIAVARMLERLASRHEIGSVLEGPTDGITGIRGLNSVPLAQRGAAVELILADDDEAALALRAWDLLGLSERVTVRSSPDLRLEVPSRSFDLVWNFNSLPQADDPEMLVREMCDASRGLVLIFVSNTRNYGFPLHRLHHRAAGEPWSHGDVGMMDVRKIEGLLEAHGFDVVERLLVDTPWWPDIDSPIEEVAATFVPFLGRLKSGSARLERYTWSVEDLPYFDPGRRAEVLAELERHFVIENAHWFPFKVLFAHHRGVLARRKEGA
jgi:hypothetical protein